MSSNPAKRSATGPSLRSNRVTFCLIVRQHGTGVHFMSKGAGFSGHDDYRDQFLKYAVQALALDYGDRQYGRHVKRRAHRVQGVARRVHRTSV